MIGSQWMPSSGQISNSLGLLEERERANSFLRPKHTELEFYYYFIIDSVSLRKEPGVIQVRPVKVKG